MPLAAASVRCYKFDPGLTGIRALHTDNDVYEQRIGRSLPYIVLPLGVHWRF
jgi:hypothetical protein